MTFFQRAIFYTIIKIILFQHILLCLIFEKYLEYCIQNFKIIKSAKEKCQLCNINVLNM